LKVEIDGCIKTLLQVNSSSY